MVTVSDKKVGVPDNSGQPIPPVDYFIADVVTANDYYPFGMQMPGRKFIQAGATPYRYSINGQEKDLELNENITHALYWEYDSRIARRWNVDPVTDESQSPYAAFDNNPIAISDPNGDCGTCPGDPIQSKYLGYIGVSLGSFGNGMTDGFVGAFSGVFEFAWDMRKEENRDEFYAGMKELISHPIDVIKAVASEKYKTWSNVLNGNGTEQEKYNVGNDMGAFLGGLVAGGGMKKLVEVIKVAQAEKQLVRVVEAADKATGAGKATTRGLEIHERTENVYSKKGRGEKAYVNGKARDEYRPKGSSNPDVRYSKNANKPKIVYDIKTGKTGMSNKQLNAYKSNLPKGTEIKTVKKNENGKYKVKTVGRVGG